MRFMELPQHKPGYCWQNVAPLGEKPEWKEVVAPWSGNAGQPRDGELFGRRESDFMKMQYKDS